MGDRRRFYIAALREFDLADLLVSHWSELDLLHAMGDDEECERRLNAWREAFDPDHYGEGVGSRVTRSVHLRGVLQQLRPRALSQFRRHMEEWLKHPLSRLGRAIDSGRTLDVENWQWAAAAYASTTLEFLHEERALQVADRRGASLRQRVPIAENVRRRYSVAGKIHKWRKDRAKLAKPSRQRLWNLLRAESVARCMAAEEQRFQQYHARVNDLRQAAQAMGLVPSPAPLPPNIEQQMLFYEAVVEQAQRAKANSVSGAVKTLQNLLRECDRLLK